MFLKLSYVNGGTAFGVTVLQSVVTVTGSRGYGSDIEEIFIATS